MQKRTLSFHVLHVFFNDAVSWVENGWLVPLLIGNAYGFEHFYILGLGFFFPFMRCDPSFFFKKKKSGLFAYLLAPFPSILGFLLTAGAIITLL